MTETLAAALPPRAEKGRAGRSGRQRAGPVETAVFVFRVGHVARPRRDRRPGPPTRRGQSEPGRVVFVIEREPGQLFLKRRFFLFPAPRGPFGVLGRKEHGVLDRFVVRQAGHTRRRSGQPVDPPDLLEPQVPLGLLVVELGLGLLELVPERSVICSVPSQPVFPSCSATGADVPRNGSPRWAGRLTNLRRSASNLDFSLGTASKAFR